MPLAVTTTTFHHLCLAWAAIRAQNTRDRAHLALPREAYIDTRCVERPSLALRIHAQGDRGAGAEGGTQQLVGRGAGIPAAELAAFIRA